jgi:hypothetical protein
MIHHCSIFDKKLKTKEGYCEAQTKCPQNGVVRKHARISGEECWTKYADANCITTHPAMQGQKTGSFQVAFDGTSSSSQ